MIALAVSPTLMIWVATCASVLVTFLLGVRLRPRPPSRPGLRAIGHDVAANATESPDDRQPSRRRSTARWHDRASAFHRRRLDRRAEVLPEDAAEWCDELARGVRSGATLRDALTNTIPRSAAVDRATTHLRRRLTRGAPVTDAAREAGDQALARGRGRQHVQVVLSVVGVAAAVGGSSASALDRSASALRLRAADRAERVTAAAQARMSAHVLTVVPVAMLLLLVATDPDVRALLGAPIGVFVVGSGLVVNALGWWWMRHIVSSGLR